MGLDETDRSILHLLQENARISNAEIGRRIGIVSSAVYQRLRRLEEERVVLHYDCVLNARELDLGLVVFIKVQASEAFAEHDTGAQLAALPHVLEVHRLVGEPCFILKARVRDTDALAALLEDEIGGIPSIGSTRTSIVMRTLKETTQLPLRMGDGDEHGRIHDACDHTPAGTDSAEPPANRELAP
jgi:Lrp/AsnC family transcriptional regulator, leucine-responsive regulatory protein